MTEQKINADLLSRIIVLLYGILKNGNPCWIYAAVKPSRYDAFLAAHKAGKVNIYKFDDYGEVIVSGEGKAPPEEITVKLAEMYQTDPATLTKDIDIDKEISKEKTKNT